MYSDRYFYLHDAHVLNTFVNVVNTTLNAQAFANNNRTVSVYSDDLDYDALCTVVDMFGNSVHDVDYDHDDCYVVYFNVALVDACD